MLRSIQALEGLAMSKLMKNNEDRKQLELPILNDINMPKRKYQSGKVKFFSEDDRKNIKQMNVNSSKYIW